MSGAGAARRGPGRRRGSVDTRAEVLEAARGEFAAKGYDGASVRGIARAARVDAALVHHFFGSKEQVFVAAMELPVDPSELVAQVLAGPRAEIAERLLRHFLAVWGNPVTRAPVVAMVRAATSNEKAAAMLRGFLARALVGRLAAGLDLPDPELRADLVGAHLAGLAMLRYVIRVEPLASASDDQVVALVAPVLQAYLTPANPPVA